MVHFIGCTFCGALQPMDRLSRWSMPGLTLSIFEIAGQQQLLSACHPDPNLPVLPPDRTITIRSWPACPDCRAEIDAGGWEPIVVRSRATHRSMGEPPELTDQIDGVQHARDAVIRRHVAPTGSDWWSPYAVRRDRSAVNEPRTE